MKTEGPCTGEIVFTHFIVDPEASVGIHLNFDLPDRHLRSIKSYKLHTQEISIL